MHQHIILNQNQYVHEFQTSPFDTAEIRGLYEMACVEKENIYIKSGIFAYTKFLREKFPFLSEYFSMFKVFPGQEWPVHIDKNRKCAINIPVANSELGVTSFYEACDVIPFEEGANITAFNRDTAKKLWSFRVTRAHLLNTGIPHSVNNESLCEERKMFSWESKLSYEETIDELIELGVQ